MIYLLDTDFCINVLRRRGSAVDQLSRLAPRDCAVSTVTVFELYSGLRRSLNPAAELVKVDEFLRLFLLLPFDPAAARAAADIRAALETKGTPIGPYDLLIAGQAISNGLTLITGNTMEFERVPGLRLVSW
jgi:tRNA(fMet)-specific endonuclease VapC